MNAYAERWAKSVKEEALSKLILLGEASPKRIRERIRRYERALKRELEEGCGGDGYGKRFLLGPLYMSFLTTRGSLISNG